MFIRSLERTHQQVTEIWWNSGMWNRIAEPTRDERIWIFGMAQTGININDVARQFDIHKTTANNQSFLANRTCWRPSKIGGNEKKKLFQQEKRFHSYHIKAGEIPSSQPDLLNVQELSMVREEPPNRLETWPMHVEDGQNTDILYFTKHIYDRHSAPYK